MNQSLIHRAEYITILQLIDVHVHDLVTDVQFISRYTGQFLECLLEVAFVAPGFEIPADIRIGIRSGGAGYEAFPSQPEQPEHEVLHRRRDTRHRLVMIDTACAGPVEFIKSHPFNGFNSRGIAIGILGQQFAPDILQTMPVILELEQHGDHLGSEHLRIIGYRQPSGKGVRAGFGLEEQRATAYHAEPRGTSIRRCIRHQLCGNHGRPVGCERRTICQFKVQQPIILGVLDFLLSQVH